jgi:hypothetical protein
MPEWRTRQTSDRSELQAYLDEDRPYAALAIGDLEPRLFGESTFAVAEADGRIGALALHFRGITPSPFQLMGDNRGLRAIMTELLRPERAYVVARPEHVPIVEEFYDWGSRGLMLRMAVGSEDFRGDDGDCVPLTTSHLDSLSDLYSTVESTRSTPNIWSTTSSTGSSRTGSSSRRQERTWSAGPTAWRPWEAYTRRRGVEDEATAQRRRAPS